MSGVRGGLRWSVLLGAVMLVACSNTPTQSEYQKDKSLPPLEVPPDLISPRADQTTAVPTLPTPKQAEAAPPAAAAAVSVTGAVPAQHEQVGPAAYKNIRLERDGTLRWLSVEAEPAALWPRLRSFWTDHGYTIERDAPELGILETAWWQAPRRQGMLRNLIEKSYTDLQNANLRDQYRMQVEPGTAQGTTEIILAHRGMEQVLQQDTPFWQPRPSDPLLEREKLAQLMVYLGASEEEAKSASSGAPIAERVHWLDLEQGRHALDLDEGYAPAWRHIGLGLERIGATVVDRDRSEGVYHVRPGTEDKPGLLSRLLHGAEVETAEKLQLRLTAQGEKTHVELTDDKGQPVSSKTAEHLLRRLYENLR